MADAPMHGVWGADVPAYEVQRVDVPVVCVNDVVEYEYRMGL